VVIQIAGAGSPSKALDFSGGSVSNSGGSPADVQIVYAGSQDIVLSGGSNSSGVVYAPNADITMSGSAPWFGAIVGKTYDSSGGISRALRPKPGEFIGLRWWDLSAYWFQLEQVLNN
jgi:hypothetical protein